MSGQSATDRYIEGKRKELDNLRKDFNALSKEAAAVAEHSAAAGRLIERLKADQQMTETQIQRLFGLDGPTLKRFLKASEEERSRSSSAVAGPAQVQPGI